MKDDRVTPLRIQYAAPSLTRANEVFGISTAGFSDEEHLPQHVVFPYPGTFLDQLKLPRNECPFRFEQTDYDMLYNRLSAHLDLNFSDYSGRGNAGFNLRASQPGYRRVSRPTVRRVHDVRSLPAAVATA